MIKVKILVIDGHGGRIGKEVVTRLVDCGLKDSVVTIGTNANATLTMVREGVAGATGENPVIVNSLDADIIIGPIGIISANSLLGEITEAMATAISKSRAQKVLIPVNRCNIRVVGVQEKPMASYINDACQFILDLSKED